MFEGFRKWLDERDGWFISFVLMLVMIVSLSIDLETPSLALAGVCLFLWVTVPSFLEDVRKAIDTAVKNAKEQDQKSQDEWQKKTKEHAERWLQFATDYFIVSGGYYTVAAFTVIIKIKDAPTLMQNVQIPTASFAIASFFLFLGIVETARAMTFIFNPILLDRKSLIEKLPPYPLAIFSIMILDLIYFTWNVALNIQIYSIDKLMKYIRPSGLIISILCLASLCFGGYRITREAKYREKKSKTLDRLDRIALYALILPWAILFFFAVGAVGAKGVIPITWP
jgi:cation transport ATPase